MADRSPTHHAPLPIAVVGGGISGLAAAHRLSELLRDVPVRLFEASPRVGGVLQTVQEDDYLVETSADNFITKLPWATELCGRLGIAGDLLPTDPKLRRALVVSGGRVVAVPEAFVLMSAGRLGPILTTPVLSLAGKGRLMLEPFVSQRPETTDESVASFARRRLGKEVFERLVQPLVAGIYTADPEKLSMRATMPQFVEQEARYGSLWRARRGDANRTDSGAAYSKFVAPRGGMSQLVNALAERLPSGTIELGVPIQRLTWRTPGAWQLIAEDGRCFEASAVVVATPASRASRLLAEADPQLSDELAQIEHASTSVVVLGVRRDQVAKPIEGFGFVVPNVERRQIIAASFSNLKFPGRAPSDRLIVRVFMGGALQPELADLPDKQSIAVAIRELGELIGLSGRPEMSMVCRWSRSMPQYHLGHLERVARIESRVAKLHGLELAGNAYHGVGIPQCIHSGEQAAERVAGALAQTRS